MSWLLSSIEEEATVLGGDNDGGRRVMLQGWFGGVDSGGVGWRDVDLSIMMTKFKMGF